MAKQQQDNKNIAKALKLMQDEASLDSLEQSCRAMDPPPPFYVEWAKRYKDPPYIKLIGNDRICTRCGDIVHEAGRKAHRRYHRALDLAIHTCTGFVGDMLQQMRQWVEEDEAAKQKEKP